MIRRTLDLPILMMAMLSALLLGTWEASCQEFPASVSPATAWYLGHSSFAVEVGAKVLVFDYTLSQGTPSADPRGGGLEDGVIHPADLAGKEVLFFTSHAHGDHYDPVILNLGSEAAATHYIFGWDAGDDAGHHELIGPRASLELDGVRVFTVNSSPDGIPEVAFIVEVEGLWIYHNGDHYTAGTDDLDHLATLTSRVDLAFLPGVARFRDTWVQKGILFLERFHPSVVFPMHLGGREGEADAWLRILRDAGLNPNALVPGHRGDRFDSQPPP